MRVKYLTSLVFAAPFLLSACAESPQTSHMSGDVYRSSEAQRPMQTAACVVTGARYVTLVDDSSAQAKRSTANQVVGTVVGGVIGKAIGNEIGAGDGRKLAKTLGTIGGAVVGSNAASNINAARTTRQGIEYRVNVNGKSERVIVQELNAGEAALPRGSSCRVTGTNQRLRVQGV